MVQMCVIKFGWNATLMALELETDDKGEVVAETILETVSVVGAKRFVTAILLVWFKKEGGGIDMTVFQMGQ